MVLRQNHHQAQQHQARNGTRAEGYPILWTPGMAVGAMAAGEQDLGEVTV